jgi:hypothetical protein
MDIMEERAHQGPFTNDSASGQTPVRTVPILQPPVIQTSAPSPGDPMDITPPATALMAPPSRTSPDGETRGTHDHIGMGDQPSSGSLAGPNAAAAAAAGAQQPKVVQTAFIHKLYKYESCPVHNCGIIANSLQYVRRSEHTAFDIVVQLCGEFCDVPLQ